MLAIRLCYAAALLLLAAFPALGQAVPAYKVVLIAGDGSLPVFDNATNAMGQRLRGEPDIVRLSAFGGHPAPHTAPATLDRVLSAVAGMHPAPGQGCLVFATSHGVRHEGFYLSLRDEVLTPRALDRALVEGCGTAPTAVIVSSCFSGLFARPPMARANRVILTAARADRTSFGCQAGRTYTVYDQCLLAAWDGGRDWRRVYAAVGGCVRAEERREDVEASEPQAWFGERK